jgi:hypothetical protein
MFEKLSKWEVTLNKITNEQKKGLFTASGRKLREKLQTRIKKEQDHLRTYLLDMASNSDKEITSGLQKMKENLQRPIANLNTYVEFVNKLQQSKVQFIKLGEQKKKLEEMKAVLGKYRVKDGDQYTSQSKISQLQSKIDQLGDELSAVEGIIKTAEETAQKNSENNVTMLADEIKTEQTAMTQQIKNIDQSELLDDKTDPKVALKKLEKLEQQFEKSLEKIEQFRSFEQTLGVEPADIRQVDEFKKKFDNRFKIWSNLETFTTFKQTWYNNNFLKQNAENIIQKVNQYNKDNIDLKMKLGKGEDKVLDLLNDEVRAVVGHKNLIQALGSDAMKPRHWQKVYACLEATAPNNLDAVGVTLQELIDEHKADKHISEIEDISGCAQGEKSIEETMKAVDIRWQE